MEKRLVVSYVKSRPGYSKKKVNKAGNNIRLDKASDQDIEIIENWRAAHSKILNDWQSTLRGRCKGKNVIFAQRLKRRATIFDKLTRQMKCSYLGCMILLDVGLYLII